MSFYKLGQQIIIKCWSIEITKILRASLLVAAAGYRVGGVCHAEKHFEKFPINTKRRFLQKQEQIFKIVFKKYFIMYLPQ